MKNRLVQLLDMEQISPSKFADIIGVQRSSVSHVISGRNNPSFDFIQKTLSAFPGLRADWLIMGEGTMYEQMGRGIPGNLFEPPKVSSLTSNPGDILSENSNEIEKPDQGTTSSHIKKDGEEVQYVEPQSVATPEDKSGHGSPKKVLQVMIFYDDKTFQSFRPSE